MGLVGKVNIEAEEIHEEGQNIASVAALHNIFFVNCKLPSEAKIFLNVALKNFY